MKRFDVIVIGSGPGGEGAAMQACKSGKKVAVVEAYRDVGGGCTHWGTIPSKALRYAVRRLMEFKSNPLYSLVADGFDLTFPQLLKTADGVIRKQVSMRHTFYDRNDCEVLHGKATFVDDHTIEVGDHKGFEERFQADAHRHRHRLAPGAAGGRRLRPPAHLRQRHHPAPGLHAPLDHHLRRRRDRLRVRLDLPQPGREGEPGQHPRQAARLPRRRDHRRAQLPPARPGRADPPQRGHARRSRAPRTAWCCTCSPASA